VRRLPLAQIIVGVSQLRQNQPAQALQTFEAVAALHPQAVEAWRGMATAYATLGRGDEERACLRRLGDLLAQGTRGPVPDLELVAAALSAYIKGGAVDRARTLFERLLRDVPRGRLRSRIELMNARFRNNFGGRGS
jgi:lipopolysaccharide biosynthesis regulator YciM